MLLHFSSTFTGEAHFCAPAFSYVLKSKKRPLLCPDVEFQTGIFTRACAQPSYRETTSYTSLQSLLEKPPTNSVKNVVKTTQQNGNHRSQLSFYTQHTKTHELSDMPMLLSFFHIFVDMVASLRCHKRKMSLLVTSLPKNDFCQTRLLQTVCLNCLGEKLVSRGRKTDMKTCAAKRFFLLTVRWHCLSSISSKKMKFLSNHAVSALLPGCKNTPITHAFHLFALSMLSKSQKFQVNASHPHCWSRKHLKMAWDTEAGQNRPIMSRTAKTGHNLKVDHASPKQQPMSRMTRKVIPVVQCCRIASKRPTTPANHLYGLKWPNLPKHVNESDSKHLVSNAGSRRKCLSGYLKGKRCNTRHSVGYIYIYPFTPPFAVDCTAQKSPLYTWTTKSYRHSMCFYICISVPFFPRSTADKAQRLGWKLAKRIKSAKHRTRFPKSQLYKYAYLGSNTSQKPTTKTQRRKDEMQIPQPDLHIIPRKKKPQKQNGARAQSKTPQAATSSIDGAFNPPMQENKSMQFKLIAEEIHIKFSESGSSTIKVKHTHKLFCTRTRRRMARERRGAGSSLVSMETPYYKTIY